MEPNSELIFTVICDDVFFPGCVQRYNDVYKTDFAIIEFIYDEVTFARLKVTRYTVDDLFQLGYQYGGLVEVKRNKGEIDW